MPSPERSLPRQLTCRSDALDGIVATIHREHELAWNAGVAMLQHALAAGEALLEAKEIVPAGEWKAWLAANAPGDRGLWTCSAYMRLAYLREHVDPNLSFTANLQLLQGMEGRSTGIAKVPDDAKAEGLRLHATGEFSLNEIARTIGVTRSTVRCWVDPEWAKAKERRRNRGSRLRVAPEFDLGERDERAFKHGEPGRAALGRAVRRLAQATGRGSTVDALLDIAAIATAWSQRLASTYDGPVEEAA